MHNKYNSFIRKIYGDSHIVHHLKVLDDMKLKENYFNKGLFFAEKHVIAVLLLIMKKNKFTLEHGLKWCD